MDEQSSALQTLLSERDALKQRCENLEALLANVGYPPGHFYSPIVDVSDRHAIDVVRTRVDAPFPLGIKIDVAAMTSMMERLAQHHRLFPFPRHQAAGYRFYFDNPFFGCYDASVLFSMLLEVRPRRIVEVGCGHSSCLLLDTNDRFFDGALNLTLIDPSLDNLQQLFGSGGPGNARLISSPVQDVAREVFEQLEANDILFLDSSHVSKTGVLVHIHDILYPFEYPEDWV